MFSLKNFTWKKFLALLVLIFLVTAVVAWLLHLIQHSDEPVFSAGALTRRFVLAVIMAFIFSLTRSEPKD